MSRVKRGTFAEVHVDNQFVILLRARGRGKEKERKRLWSIQRFSQAIGHLDTFLALYPDRFSLREISGDETHRVDERERDVGAVYDLAQIESKLQAFFQSVSPRK